MADDAAGDFYDMSSDDECDDLEIVTTQQNQAQPSQNPDPAATSNIPAPQPENDETFAAMMVDRLRELTADQRLLAQREIVRILNQFNQPSAEPSQAAPAAPSAPLPSAPPANQYPDLQVLQPFYGINYLQRRPQDGPRRQEASESPEIEWGEIFTPHNNLGP